MAISVIRFQDNATARWGILFGDKVAMLDDAYPTTGDLLRHGQDNLRRLTPADATLPLAQLHILSPVTGNQQVLCQGINYGSHVRESGMDPDKIGFNTIFTKASSSMCGAQDNIIRPAHVRLLDYEIELGLVLGCDLTGPIKAEPDNLHKFLAGVTIVNDISARDVQLPQTQFYKGKSYRSFCPTGPVLVLLDAAEWRRWGELRMQRSVNGVVRQDAHCGEMLFPPHKTLTELSQVHDLFAGDLIATGTPAGCAAVAPGKAVMFIMRHFMTDSTKWRLFTKKGARNPRYLQPGDEVVAAISTEDSAIDLGAQRNRVVAR